MKRPKTCYQTPVFTHLKFIFPGSHHSAPSTHSKSTLLQLFFPKPHLQYTPAVTPDQPHTSLIHFHLKLFVPLNYLFLLILFLTAFNNKNVHFPFLLSLLIILRSSHLLSCLVSVSQEHRCQWAISEMAATVT